MPGATRLIRFIYSLVSHCYLSLLLHGMCASCLPYPVWCWRHYTFFTAVGMNKVMRPYVFHLYSVRIVCVFFTLNRYFYLLTSSTTSVRALYFILERNFSCGHKLHHSHHNISGFLESSMFASRQCTLLSRGSSFYRVVMYAQMA